MKLTKKDIALADKNQNYYKSYFGDLGYATFNTANKMRIVMSESAFLQFFTPEYSLTEESSWLIWLDVSLNFQTTVLLNRFRNINYFIKDNLLNKG